MFPGLFVFLTNCTLTQVAYAFDLAEYTAKAFVKSKFQRFLPLQSWRNSAITYSEKFFLTLFFCATLSHSLYLTPSLFHFACRQISFYMWIFEEIKYVNILFFKEQMGLGSAGGLLNG